MIPDDVRFVGVRAALCCMHAGILRFCRHSGSSPASASGYEDVGTRD